MMSPSENNLQAPPPVRRPLVSVVMPVCNGADSVRRSALSILEQTLANLELIAIDDGSSDQTAAILRDLAAADPRLRFLPLGKHQGIVAALEHGIAAARGDLIARMDADDIARPQRLARQCGFLQQHPDIGLVSCQVHFAGNGTRQRGYALYVDWLNSLLSPAEIALNRFVESPLAHPSVVFRREVHARLGGYREGNFPEDYELWLRWLEQGVRLAKIPETLLEWADPPDRLSRTDPRYSCRAFYRCKATYLARWLARHNPHHPQIIVWGAGRETRKRAEMLAEMGVDITHYIDIDPRRIGQVIHGKPVLGETNLPSPEQAFVVSYVGSRGARDDIRARLAQHGFLEGANCIMAA